MALELETQNETNLNVSVLSSLKEQEKEKETENNIKQINLRVDRNKYNNTNNLYDKNKKCKC